MSFSANPALRRRKERIESAIEQAPNTEKKLELRMHLMHLEKMSGIAPAQAKQLYEDLKTAELIEEVTPESSMNSDGDDKDE